MCFRAKTAVFIAALWLGSAAANLAAAQTTVTNTQELIAAVTNAAPGDVIELDADTFELDGTLTIDRSDITLRGRAGGTTTLVFNDRVMFGGVQTPLIDLSGQSNVVLRNLTLDGDNNAQGASIGVFARNASGLSLESLSIRNLTNDGTFAPIGVFFDGRVHDSVIRDSNLTDIGVADVFGSGIRIHGDSDGNLVEHNTIDRGGRGGIFAQGNPDNGDDFGQTFLENLTVRHNTVTNSALADPALTGFADLGIEAQNDVRGLVVEDNTVDRRISLDNIQNAAVRGNTLTQAENNTAARDIGFAGIEIVDTQSFVATDNRVLAGVHIGLSISGDGVTRNALFAGNTFEGATTFGVQIQGRDNDAAGIAGTAEQLLLLDNTITGTTGGSDALFFPDFETGDGVRFNMAFDRITLSGNTIGDNAGQDVFLNAAPADSLVHFLGNTGVNENGDPAALSLTGTGHLRITETSLTQQTVEAELGDTLVLVFDDLGGTITDVLWDPGDGVPFLTNGPELLLDPAVIGDARRLLAVGFDDTGTADTVLVQIVGSAPEPGAGLLLAAGIGLFTIRPSRRREPCPSRL